MPAMNHPPGGGPQKPLAGRLILLSSQVSKGASGRLHSPGFHTFWLHSWAQDIVLPKRQVYISLSLHLQQHSDGVDHFNWFLGAADLLCLQGCGAQPCWLPHWLLAPWLTTPVYPINQGAGRERRKRFRDSVYCHFVQDGCPHPQASEDRECVCSSSASHGWQVP